MHGHREIDPDGVQYLIQAIVDRAVKDYFRTANSAAMRQDAQRFFLSEWFEQLTGFDGKTVLRHLIQKHNKRHRRKRGRGQ